MAHASRRSRSLGARDVVPAAHASRRTRSAGHAAQRTQSSTDAKRVGMTGGHEQPQPPAQPAPASQPLKFTPRKLQEGAAAQRSPSSSARRKPRPALESATPLTAKEYIDSFSTVDLSSPEAARAALERPLRLNKFTDTHMLRAILFFCAMGVIEIPSRCGLRGCPVCFEEQYRQADEDHKESVRYQTRYDTCGKRSSLQAKGVWPSYGSTYGLPISNCCS